MAGALNNVSESALPGGAKRDTDGSSLAGIAAGPLSALFPSQSNSEEMLRMEKLIVEKQGKAARIRSVRGLNFDAAASLVLKAGGAGVAKNRQDN